MDTVRAAHYNLNIPYICTQYVSFTPSIFLFTLIIIVLLFLLFQCQISFELLVFIIFCKFIELSLYPQSLIMIGLIY